jgi:hypothetical protein
MVDERDELSDLAATIRSLTNHPYGCILTFQGDLSCFQAPEQILSQAVGEDAG